MRGRNLLEQKIKRNLSFLSLDKKNLLFTDIRGISLLLYHQPIMKIFSMVLLSNVPNVILISIFLLNKNSKNISLMFMKEAKTMKHHLVPYKYIQVYLIP